MNHQATPHGNSRPSTDCGGKIGHTRGPWEAIKGSEPGDDMRCAVVAKRGGLAYLVATIENGAPGDVCDTEWANAQVMAASLRMLEALEAIDELASDEIATRQLEDGSELHSLLVLPRNIARAAISKALGESTHD
jgi:hypothetical protein